MSVYDYPMMETERLLLRAPRNADATDVFAFCSDPASCQYADWYPHSDKGETRAYIAWLKKQARIRRETGYTWFVECKACRKVIATISVVAWDSSGSIATVGYTLSREYQHRGYATEMLEAVLRYLFLERSVARVDAKVIPENEPSIRLLERVGMRQEALLRSGTYCKTACVDVYLYALLREEFLKTKAARGEDRFVRIGI